jgi:DNA end-binding protein Ku
MASTRRRIQFRGLFANESVDNRKRARTQLVGLTSKHIRCAPVRPDTLSTPLNSVAQQAHVEGLDLAVPHPYHTVHDDRVNVVADAALDERFDWIEDFHDIADEKIPKDMLELASHIVETKSGHFKPEKFEDHYEDALKELLRKKQSGQKIEVQSERAPAKVINLMDALRRSVDAERGGGGEGERRAAASRRTPKKAARSNSRKSTG